MHLGGVHLSLDDVQDGDVAVVVSTITWSRHHHILWLREAGYILKVSQDTRPNCIKKSSPKTGTYILPVTTTKIDQDPLDLGRHAFPFVLRTGDEAKRARNHVPEAVLNIQHRINHMQQLPVPVKVFS